MNALFFYVTVVCYFAATVTYLASLIKPQQILGRIALWLSSAGLVFHCIFTIDRFIEAGHTPITNLHESLSFFSLAIVAVFIVFLRAYRVAILGAFVMPVSLILLLVSFGFTSAITRGLMSPGSGAGSGAPRRAAVSRNSRTSVRQVSQSG